MRAKLRGLIALIALVACASDTSPSFTGVYTLRTIGGRSLPQDVDGFRMLSGHIVLHADSTFVDVLRYAWDGLASADTLSGVYASRGDTLVMRAAELSYLIVVQRDGTLAAEWRGVAFRYRR